MAGKNVDDSAGAGTPRRQKRSEPDWAAKAGGAGTGGETTLPGAGPVLRDPHVWGAPEAWVYMGGSLVAVSTVVVSVFCIF